MNQAPTPAPRSLSDIIGQIRTATMHTSVSKRRLSEINQRLSGRSTPTADGETADRPAPPLLVQLAEAVDDLLQVVGSIEPELAIAEEMAEVNQPSQKAQPVATVAYEVRFKREPGASLPEYMMPDTQPRHRKPRAKKAPARKAKR